MLARKHKLVPATLSARPHRTLRGEHLALRYAPRAGRIAKSAVIVPAKTLKSSVLRHRVKRVLFTELRVARPAGVDLVVTVHRAPAADRDHTLRAELGHLLGRIA